MNQLELIADAQAALGEGPCWDRDRQVLYWVDIMGKIIHVYDPEGQHHQEFQLDQYIGTVVPAKSGKLICAMQEGFYSLDPESGKLESLYDPESSMPDNRFNDGKCDAAGRLWAGTMSLSGVEKAGALYCLEPDLSCRKMIPDVSISNGLAWTADHRTMYYIDTPTGEVAAYPFDLETGSLGDKEVVVRFPQQDGSPDGMTIDREGKLWIALWGGWGVVRYDPDTGECLQKIDLPVSQVTSCTFGGTHLDELYITSARVGLDEDALRKEPLAGGLFRIKTETMGWPANKFG